MTGSRPISRRGRAEGDTMIEAPFANSFHVLEDADISYRGSLDYMSQSNNRMECLSRKNYEQGKKGVPFGSSDDIAMVVGELFTNPVDTPVPGALEDSDMSESPIVRSELERIEARIVEVRKLELETEARIAATIAEDQRILRELVEDRAGLERLAALARKVLSGPPATAMAALPASETPALSDASPLSRIVPVSPRRAMHEGSKRERAFKVIKKILVERGGPVHRAEFLDALVEAGLLDDAKEPGQRLSAMLTHYKDYGLITTDNHGFWSLVSFDQHPVQRSYAETKTVER